MATNLIDKRGKVNTERLNEDIRKQQEAFSYIDSGMAVLEKMPDLAEAWHSII